MISKVIFWFYCFFSCSVTLMRCVTVRTRYVYVLEVRLHYMGPFETQTTAASPFEPFKRQTVTRSAVWANTE